MNETSNDQNQAVTLEPTDGNGETYYGYPIDSGYVGFTKSGKKMLFASEQDYKEWEGDK